MFHLAAFTGSLAAGPVAVPALSDPALVLAPSGNGYQFQDPYDLIGAYALGALLTDCYINSPTLNIINKPYIRPVYGAANPASADQIASYQKFPVKLPALENVVPFATNSAAGPTQTNVLLWIRVDRQDIAIPPGQRLKIRMTSTTAAVANAWTLMAVTLDTQLPGGTYMIVGSEHVSTTAIAHRVVFPNIQWRPGSLSHTSKTHMQDFHLLEMQMGGYYTFKNTAVPQMEVLCGAADASHTFWWEIVPVSVPGIMAAGINQGIVAS